MGGSGVAGRQVMKCDVPLSRNSSVSVLFSLVPWVSPAFSPAILVSAHIRWLDRAHEAHTTSKTHKLTKKTLKEALK